MTQAINQRHSAANHVAAPQKPQTQQSELPVIKPLVNIIEADNGFTLSVEMPGVPKENVELSVENNTLVLSGTIALDLPDGMEANYAEVTLQSYRRAFTLSKDLDSNKIEAVQKDGLLHVYIPKKEQAQPRKITVEVA